MYLRDVRCADEQYGEGAGLSESSFPTMGEEGLTNQTHQTGHSVWSHLVKPKFIDIFYWGKILVIGFTVNSRTERFGFFWLMFQFDLVKLQLNIHCVLDLKHIVEYYHIIIQVLHTGPFSMLYISLFTAVKPDMVRVYLVKSAAPFYSVRKCTNIYSNRNEPALTVGQTAVSQSDPGNIRWYFYSNYSRL